MEELSNIIQELEQLNLRISTLRSDSDRLKNYQDKLMIMDAERDLLFVISKLKAASVW